MKTSKILGITAVAIGITSIAILISRNSDKQDDTKLPDSDDQQSATKRIQSKPQRDEPSIKASTTPTVPKPKVPVDDEFPLRLGSNGKRVERLQIWLMRNHGWTRKVTGILDEHTQDRMNRFLKTTELDEATYMRLKMNKPVYQP